MAAAGLFATAPALTQLLDARAGAAGTLTLRCVVTVVAAVVFGRPRRGELRQLLAPGLAITVGYYGATTIGYAIAPASVASLGLAAEPLVLSALLPLRAQPRRAVPVAVLAGSSMVLGGGASMHLANRDAVGIGVVALGAFAFVIGARALPRPGGALDAVRIAARAQALGAVALLLVLVLVRHAAVTSNPLSWLAMAGLVAGSSLVGIGLFTVATHGAPLIAAASLALTQPLASLLATLVLHDPFPPAVVVGSALGAAAVLLAVWPTNPR